MVDIIIHRLESGEPLVIERAERVAEGFFRLDPSSRAGGLDAQLGKTPRDEIVADDLTTINRTFVARSAPKYWVGILDAGPLRLLAALDPAWDLIALEDAKWQRLECRDRLGDALTGLQRKYVGPAVATKMLHLKRWRLVPVCDSFVAHQIGASTSTSTIALIDHIRAQGRANLLALSSIQSYLEGRGIDRSLVRILDALLWTSHPASLTYPLIGLIHDWTEPSGPTRYH
jgi:hypothetical protein